MDLYYWCTPNGHKLVIALEELGMEYQLHPVNILKGEQFTESYLAINPNGKIPALNTDSGIVFDSAACLLWLGRNTEQLIPDENQVLSWLFWQSSGLGPMAGQNHHFNKYAPTPVPYAINRYEKETARLYGVLDQQIGEKDFILDEYSIVDIACYPWVEPHRLQNIELAKFPNVERWFWRMSKRPAVVRAYKIADQFQHLDRFDQQAQDAFFGFQE